jgi:hypothetical protein
MSTLLAETFLIDVGISNPGERPFEWYPATSRLQGAVALRLRISVLHFDLAALGEWSATHPQPSSWTQPNMPPQDLSEQPCLRRVC